MRIGDARWKVPENVRPARREILTQNGLVKGDGMIQTYAGRSPPTRAFLSQGPLLNRQSQLFVPCPAEANSTRQSVIHDDLEPPQTTGRRAGS